MRCDTKTEKGDEEETVVVVEGQDGDGKGKKGSAFHFGLDFEHPNCHEAAPRCIHMQHRQKEAASTARGWWSSAYDENATRPRMLNT